METDDKTAPWWLRKNFIVDMREEIEVSGRVQSRERKKETD